MTPPLAVTCPWVASWRLLPVTKMHGLHNQGWVLLRLVLCFMSWPSCNDYSRLVQQSSHPVSTGDGFDHRLAVAVSSVFVWLAAISALPHKEERFLYVVYPLVSCNIFSDCGGCCSKSRAGIKCSPMLFIAALSR